MKYGLRSRTSRIDEAGYADRLEADGADASLDSLSSLTSGFDDDDLVKRIMVRARESEITVDFDRMLLSSNPDSRCSLWQILLLPYLPR